MANYSNLKTAIENAVDWNNGDNEITGQNLLDILETIIDSLGAKYKFADVATPASSITTPDEPLFYLAGEGTYTNFSGLSVTIPRGTLAIFYYDTAWHYTTVRTDSDAFFNVNQYLGAPSTTYTKANGRNAVPSALRSKGMIITYLTTDGWIIEQNLSTSGTWNADANWQTIGPVSVSQNTQTLEIGGVEQGALGGVFIDNPEWVKVVTDKDGKILYGVKVDGKFYFGADCPPQIMKYIDIIIADKVDKVDGLSLIDEIFASAQGSTDNPEWLDVKLDENGNIIEGTRKDGVKVINIKTQIKNTEIINKYNSIKDAALKGESGTFRIGKALMNSVVESPLVYYHKQDAYATPYYDANRTCGQFVRVNNQKNIQTNICNSLKQEEIDFAPADTTRTRILIGKDSDDRFFFANVRCDFGDGAGDASLNCLEVSTDFVNFTPIFKSHNDTSGMGGLSVDEVENIVPLSVKQFANGSYLIATHHSKGGYFTSFLLMSADFSEIHRITCTYLDHTTGYMTDEFAGRVYDWHMDIKGNLGICTTYGDRQPETDKGRVWFTDDNGETWNQVFQMTNHYQDGVEGETITYTHVHGVMIDTYSNRIFVIAGEANSNLFWSDKGMATTDSDWNVIPIRRQMVLPQQSYMQVVNGYAFADNLVFGSDNEGAGAFYRINKMKNDKYSSIQLAHEVLPNKYAGTYYCAASMFRRDKDSPVFMCITHENVMSTETANENLNKYHKARVIATYNGIDMFEVWEDDTYGEHFAYIGGVKTTRNFSYCTRDMNFYLLKNGDAIIKYSGRNFAYFGGTPLYSVEGKVKASCKVRKLFNLKEFI